MTEGRGFKRITAGDMTQMAAAAGVTPRANGFSLGTDADLNAAGEKISWVAHE